MYNLLFLFTIFISVFDYRIPFLNYWDELSTLIVLLIFLYKLISYKKIKKTTANLILIIIGLLLLGIIGNIANKGIQDSSVAIIKDIIAFLKFPIIAIMLPRDRDSKLQYKITHKAASISKVIIVITLFVALIGYFIDIGVYTDEIRILKCFQFLYNHPTFYVTSYILVLSVLIADSIEDNKIFIILGSLLILLAQRTKGFFAIAMIVCLLVMGEKRISKLFTKIRGRIKLKPKTVVLLTILLFALGWIIGRTKIQDYFQYGLLAARPALYIVGIKIADDMFPLGSGFGTFASSISGEYYSNIYGRYGISNVLGMCKNEYNYIGDTFWPYIYGQLGFIGLIFYVWFIIRIFKEQILTIENYNKMISVLFLWMYVIFSSSAEAFFTNGTAVQVLFILYIFIGTDSGKGER